jgi:hypothetical protein
MTFLKKKKKLNKYNKIWGYFYLLTFRLFLDKKNLEIAMISLNSLIFCTSEKLNQRGKKYIKEKPFECPNK